MRTTAGYYDGQTAGAETVALEFVGRSLKFDLAGATQWVELDTTTVVEPVGRGPWIVELADGASLKITDADFGEKLADESGSVGFIRMLEGAWHWALISIVVAIVATWAALTYGVPAFATTVAFALPENVSSALSDEGLGVMDDVLFDESELPPETIERVTGLFRDIKETNSDFWSYRLVFRASRIGPNAFAVPGGIVVMTDELVELAESDEEIIAVLAHEVGHLHGRHSLRILLQNSTSALLIAGLTGDISNITALAAAIPTVLMQAKYSRDFEREADDFAFEYLEFRGVSTNALSELLQRLELSESDESDDSGGIPGWLSSHPPSRERIDTE
ncbi:MAG: M48 family metallopeptidase [Woeseiaceae bacterium]